MSDVQTGRVVKVAGTVEGVYPSPVEANDPYVVLDFLKEGEYSSVLLTMAEGYDAEGNLVPWATPAGNSMDCAFQFRNRLEKGVRGGFRVTERYLHKTLVEVEGEPHEVVATMVREPEWRGSLRLTFLNERHDPVERAVIALEVPEEPEE